MKRFTIFSICTWALMCLSCVTQAWGAVLWVNPAGSATSPYETKAKGVTTIQAGFAAMGANDTLYITNGTYTGSSNMISNTQRPPDGTGGNYTTIQAETIGGVIIDGETTSQPLLISDESGISYVKFDGIHFKRGTVAGGGNVRLFYSDHVKFTNCSSSYAADGGHGFSIVGCSYCLVEDSWVWGHAQYAFQFREGDHHIARRCVARLDYALSGDLYTSAYISYGSDYTEFQNCLAIDQDQNTFLDDGTSGVVYVATDHNGYTSPGLVYRGCIFLNCYTSQAGIIDAENAGTTHEFQDVVLWGIFGDPDDFYDKGNGDAADPIWNHCTVGGNSVASGRGYYCSAGGEGHVTNSIALDVTGTSYYNLSSITDCLSYTTGNDTLNVGTTTRLTTATDPLTAGLLYLPRVETGSWLKTAGTDGTYIGSTITKKIGTSGTLYGETGYATTTEDDLWPWPNEAKIKSDMSADVHGTIVEARGFCASGKQLNETDDITLTSYIWEYLGNALPAGIYDAEDTTPPTSSGVSGSGVSRQ